MSKSVSLIATGDELVKGDYLDTNSHYFANLCSQNNIAVVSQQLVLDDQAHIERAVGIHIKNADAVIICGGMGPTSDDKTRFAIANVCQEKLIFNDKIYSLITKRIAKFNINLHESNKQQALFPKNCDLIPNEEGIAYGFKIEYQNKLIYALPGPPKECLPMFENYVIKDLKKHNFANYTNLLFYKMLGVIEPDIASDIDNIIKGSNLKVAYRWNYPYLDVKIIYSMRDKVYKGVQSYILQKYTNNIVSTKDISALEKLNNLLSNNSLMSKIFIYDNLTRGYFASKLFNNNQVQFINNKNSHTTICFEGLDEYHNNYEYKGETALICNVNKGGELLYQDSLIIPYKNKDVLNYAVEYMAYQIVKIIGDIL